MHFLDETPDIVFRAFLNGYEGAANRAIGPHDQEVAGAVFAWVKIVAISEENDAVLDRLLLSRVLFAGPKAFQIRDEALQPKRHDAVDGESSDDGARPNGHHLR